MTEQCIWSNRASTCASVVKDAFPLAIGYKIMKGITDLSAKKEVCLFGFSLWLNSIIVVLFNKHVKLRICEEISIFTVMKG
jgi:hypothetical protein